MTITKEQINAACRALAIAHYTKTLGRPADDHHVIATAEGELLLFEDTVRIVLDVISTDLEAIEEALYGRHERGFIMRPLIDPPSLPDAVKALKADLKRVNEALKQAEAYNEEEGDPADTLHHGRAVLNVIRRVLNKVESDGQPTQERT